MPVQMNQQSSCEWLESRRLLSTPNLLVDVNPATLGAAPSSFVELNGYVYFAADDGSSGRELWRTDGTTNGTSRVVDLNPGAGGASPDHLIVSGGLLYFGATGPQGPALWKSDGTVAGTSMVKAFPGGVFEIADVNGTLFVSAADGLRGTVADVYGQELWKSDGTTDGTVMVKDIHLGKLGSAPDRLTPMGGKLYFVAHEGSSGLWVSDGTPNGTFQLNDRTVSGPIQAVGSRVYYANGSALMRSDGTFGGTVTVHSFADGDPGPVSSLNGWLYLLTDNSGVHRLWKTDGTDLNTKPLSALYTVGMPAQAPVVLNGVVYFAGSDAAGGVELWRSDGTTVGTKQVADINPGSGSSTPRDLAIAGGKLYFSADDGASGRELWVSDGTAAGTRRVKDLLPGTPTSTPGAVLDLIGRTFFTADDGPHGREMFVTDGSAAGTSLIKDIDLAPASSNPTTLIVFNGDLYYTADEGPRQVGQELWKINLATGQTTFLKDLTPGPDGSNVTAAVVFKAAVYFSLENTGRRELWKTDGTPAGTIMVKSLPTQSRVGYRNWLTVSGDAIYFVPGTQLWRSDGTPSGTGPAPYVPQTNSPDWLTDFNGRLYFLWYDPATGTNLWATDGTQDGTSSFRVTDGPRALTKVGGELFFVAGNFPSDAFYKSDGTSAGTVLIRQAGTIVDPKWTATDGHRFYCLGYGASDLWSSDGTFDGTTLVHVFTGYDPLGLGVAGHTAYVTTPNELWKSDGTVQGTSLVKTVGTRDYYLPSPPPEFTAAGGEILFRVRLSGYGAELWRSDGTLAGTQMFDIYPGAAESLPDGIIGDGTMVFFAATNPTYGRELWQIRGDDVPPFVAAASLDPGAPLTVRLQFSEALAGGGVAPGDFVLTNLTTGSVVAVGALALAWDEPTSTASLAIGGVADGNYRLVLRGGSVTDTAGNPLSTDFTYDFFVLRGDVNRDRSVDFTDLVILAQNYGATGKTWSQADLTGDGNVDFNDLTILAQRYGTSLSPPPAAAIAPAPAPVAAASSIVRARPAPKSLFSVTPVAKPAVKTKVTVRQQRR